MFVFFPGSRQYLTDSITSINDEMSGFFNSVFFAGIPPSNLIFWQNVSLELFRGNSGMCNGAGTGSAPDATDRAPGS
jgi:hypothetical protein